MRLSVAGQVALRHGHAMGPLRLGVGELAKQLLVADFGPILQARMAAGERRLVDPQGVAIRLVATLRVEHVLASARDVVEAQIADGERFRRRRFGRCSIAT